VRCPLAWGRRRGLYLPGLFEEFSRFIELSECFEGIGYYPKDLAYELSALDVSRTEDRDDKEWSRYGSGAEERRGTQRA